MCIVIFLLCAIPTVAADKENISSPDIELLKTLGVFPEDITPGEALTRNDLARIYFGIIMPSMANEEYVPMPQSKFTDIGDEHFAANFVTQMGIMNGTGETTFEPNGTLNYTQLIKTVVNFLGYADMARSYGGYPNGYLKCAVSLGLGKYADYSDNIVTTDVAAAIFMTATEVKIAENIFTTTKTQTVMGKSENYLEHYLNIYEKEGIVSANYIENIYEKGNTKEYYYINIGDETFLLSDTTLFLRRYMGYNAAAYVKYDSDGDWGKVLFCKETKNKVYTVESDDVIGYDRDASRFLYYENNKKKSLNMRGAAVLYNGILEESYNESILNPFTDKTLDGNVKLIDNNQDGRIDAVAVSAYKSYVVTKIVDEKIYNKYHPAEIFDISEISDGEIPVTNVLGNTIEMGTIESGDIISVFKGAGASGENEIREICVSVDNYTGTIKQIIKTGEKLEKITVDSTEYDFANMYATENKDNKELRAETKVKIYFDFNGKVCEAETDDFSKERYGYLVGFAAESSIREDYKMKILTAASEFLVADVADRVRFNKNMTKVKDVETALGKGDDGKSVKRQLIKYVYDKDKNTVTEIATVDDSIDETQDGFYKYKNLDSAKVFEYFVTASKSFNAKLLLSGSSIVFIVPSEENRDIDEYYSAQDSNYFDNDRNSQTDGFFEAYGTKAHNPTAEVMVVPKKTGIVGNSKTTDYMIIQKCGVKRDADGEFLNYAKGFVNGKEVEYLFKYDKDFYINNGRGLQCGDVIKIGLDKDGKISKANFICCSKDKKLGSSDAPNQSSADVFSKPRFLIGSVLYFDDISMTLEIKDNPPSTDVTLNSYPTTGIKIYEYIEDGKNSRVTLADPSVIHDSVHNGSPAQMFLYTESTTPYIAVVYHN